ncbi:uncharacterized protein [Haliotis cracherodii]|uniref:uncharacterized protein n=1 Tax=Haliotis cracherodii TaxID=6455 RepID=UPI0039EC1C70
MGCLARFLTFSLFCSINTSVAKDVLNATELGTIIGETRSMTENLTERMNAMAAIFRESLRLMKSADVKMRQLMEQEGGPVLADNKTDAEHPGGAIYTRWGQHVCPEGSDIAYTGFTTGGYSGHTGAGTNVLCTHSSPQFDRTFIRNTTKHNYLYGAEYEEIWKTSLVDQDAPCVVCRSVSRATAILVPGRHECMTGWNTEYYGFLVGSKHDDAGNSDYICLDSDPGSIEGGYQDHDGRWLFNVVFSCGALPCPPYKNDYFVPCALCTK